MPLMLLGLQHYEGKMCQMLKYDRISLRVVRTGQLCCPELVIAHARTAAATSDKHSSGPLQAVAEGFEVYEHLVVPDIF